MNECTSVKRKMKRKNGCIYCRYLRVFNLFAKKLNKTLTELLILS